MTKSIDILPEGSISQQMNLTGFVGNIFLTTCLLISSIQALYEQSHAYYQFYCQVGLKEKERWLGVLKDKKKSDDGIK